MCVDQHTTYVDRVAYAVSLYFHILDHCKDQIHENVRAVATRCYCVGDAIPQIQSTPKQQIFIRGFGDR